MMWISRIRAFMTATQSGLHHEPRHVVFYGAGVYRLRICVHLPRYGLERWDLINTRDRLLAFLDQGDVRLSSLTISPE